MMSTHGQQVSPVHRRAAYPYHIDTLLFCINLLPYMPNQWPEWLNIVSQKASAVCNLRLDAIHRSTKALNKPFRGCLILLPQGGMAVPHRVTLPPSSADRQHTSPLIVRHSPKRANRCEAHRTSLHKAIRLEGITTSPDSRGIKADGQCASTSHSPPTNNRELRDPKGARFRVPARRLTMHIVSLGSVRLPVRIGNY
ncbi:hypothetical protein BC628DRAFT_148635 [Trametes gibbosa]|nr:hypothetical protein BC628DRAFT_148635 [Trametes gibbosa]